MTDTIRAAAIEAALSAYRASTSDDVREVMSAAIDAYERAMGRSGANAAEDRDVLVLENRPLPSPPEDAE